MRRPGARSGARRHLEVREEGRPVRAGLLGYLRLMVRRPRAVDVGG